MEHERTSWDEFFMSVAEKAAERSRCVYYKIGAVIAAKKQLLSIGYNGPPRGVEHCTDVGCAKKNGKRCRGAHGEINAIINAANNGVRVSGATFYCTCRPCLDCTKHLINAGIETVVYRNEYLDENNQPKEPESIAMLEQVGIRIIRLAENEKNKKT